LELAENWYVAGLHKNYYFGVPANTLMVLHMPQASWDEQHKPSEEVLQ